MDWFEELLRRGLMDANLAQYENALRRAESQEPEFSPQYLRNRTRLLADPWGWMKCREQAGQHKRRNWRLIALIAALLLLSACAYAVATGQFSQWFPGLGVAPAAPEVSEDVMSRTSAVIEQTKNVGNATVTLNAALWDGSYMYLSLVIKNPDIPEEITQYTPLYTQECSLQLREDQWHSYVRKNLEESYAVTGQPLDQLEENIRTELEQGQTKPNIRFDVLSRGENTLTIQLTALLSAYVEQPELTLHLENIAFCGDGIGENLLDENGVPTAPEPGVIFLKGPVDFTFTLEKAIRPVRYGGVDLQITLLNVPFRFTGFALSVTRLSAFFDVLAPVNMPSPSELPDPDGLGIQDIVSAAYESIWGLRTEDGNYVDLMEAAKSASNCGTDRNYPWPIDLASVTAVDVAGTRVELSELERLTE